MYNHGKGNKMQWRIHCAIRATACVQVQSRDYPAEATLAIIFMRLPSSAGLEHVNALEIFEHCRSESILDVSIKCAPDTMFREEGCLLDPFGGKSYLCDQVIN